MTLREQEALKEIEKVSDMWREREREKVERRKFGVRRI